MCALAEQEPRESLAPSQNSCRGVLCATLPALQWAQLLQCLLWQGTGPTGTSGAKPVGLVHYGGTLRMDERKQKNLLAL